MVSPNNRAVDPLPEPNSSDMAARNVVKLYVTPNTVAVDRNVAATTNHPRRESTSAVARRLATTSLTNAKDAGTDEPSGHAPTTR